MSGFALKMIALTAMIIDHAGSMLTDLEMRGRFFTSFDVFNLRIAGRIAFPIYAFFIAEGCKKTRDINKYLLRLAAFALLSEIPYDLFIFHDRLYDFSMQNVFFTLFFGALAVKASKSGLPVPLKGALTLGVFSLGYLMKTDYGASGVIFIWALYYLPEHWQKSASVFIMAAYLYLGSLTSASFALTAACSVSGLLLALYNGQKGRGMKWLFYSIYPAHLLVFSCLFFILDK